MGQWNIFVQFSRCPESLCNFDFFLDASSHLYKRVCPSVRSSVHPSVRPSVGPSVRRAVTPFQNEPFVRKKIQDPILCASAYSFGINTKTKGNKNVSLSLSYIHSHARAHTYANNNHDADIIKSDDDADNHISDDDADNHIAPSVTMTTKTTTPTNKEKNKLLRLLPQCLKMTLKKKKNEYAL